MIILNNYCIFIFIHSAHSDSIHQQKKDARGASNVLFFGFVLKLIVPPQLDYIGSAEGHEYPDLQVGDEVNPRPVFIFS